MDANKFQCLEFTLFLILFAVSLSLNFATQKYSFPNPDTNQIALFSDLLARNQTLSYCNELNIKYGIPVFGIRSLLTFDNKCFVPSMMPGIIVVHALFKSAYLPTFFVNPVFVLIAIYFFSKTVSIFLFKDKVWSLFAVTIYSSSAAFVHWSSLPFKDLAATATFFAGLYYILSAIYDKKASNYALFGLFAGITMWMSYPNVIFYFPALALDLFNMRNEILKRQNLRNLIVTLVFFSPFLVSLYMYQVRLFDGFLNFNDPILRLNHYEEFNVRVGILSFVLNVNISRALLDFFYQIFLVNPILVFLSILGFLYFLLDTVKKKRVDRVLSVLLILVIMQFLFYLGKTWYGEQLQGSVATSYSRYLLVSWGVLVIFATIAISRMYDSLSKRRIMKTSVPILLFIYLVVSGVVGGLFTPMSIKYDIEVSEWANEIRNDIERNTPENSVIFTSFYDKYIYPTRQTAIYVAIPEEERLSETISLMRELLEDGYSVYIVDERDDYAISPVLSKDLFEKNGLKTEKALGNFYKITLG